nr:HAMP domain-containing histidine kinase [Aliarcobacter sp.]
MPKKGDCLIMTIIDVIDNGGGIPADVIDKLAQPYFTTKGTQEGTGLGLYMSRMITQKHLEGTLE